MYIVGVGFLIVGLVLAPSYGYWVILPVVLLSWLLGFFFAPILAEKKMKDFAEAFAGPVEEDDGRDSDEPSGVEEKQEGIQIQSGHLIDIALVLLVSMCLLVMGWGIYEYREKKTTCSVMVQSLDGRRMNFSFSKENFSEVKEDINEFRYSVNYSSNGSG